VAPYYINEQAIPQYLNVAVGAVPVLEYTIAISSSAFLTGLCSSNVYEIKLYECPTDVNEVGRINTGLINETCKNQNNPLQFCPDMKYVCYVTDGPSPPFTEPIYVEWHWTVEALHPVGGRPSYYTGKFVYVATSEWLNNFPGGTYPIPLLNQTNHTPK
jgi:hypothetical protein